MISSSAPGKLVLLGEYAVLDQVPAVAMAVNRRASVTLRQQDQSSHSLSSSVTPGKQFHFSLKQGRFRWHSHDGGNPAQTALPQLCPPQLAAWLEQRQGESQGWHLHLDSDAFYQNGRKLGLGSSAALTVALDGLLQRPADSTAADLPRLLQRHKGVQQGLGSGIDVATCLSGGIIRFQRQGAAVHCSPLNLPQEWPWCCIWTGVSASTGRLLKQLRSWILQSEEIWTDMLRRAAAISQAGITALQNNDLSAWQDQIAAYGNWMALLQRQSGMPIITKAHRELGKIAAMCGVSYKPSGAGGGDVGIAFADNREALERFNREISQTGCQPLSLSTDYNGLALNEEHTDEPG